MEANEKILEKQARLEKKLESIAEKQKKLDQDKEVVMSQIADIAKDVRIIELEQEIERLRKNNTSEKVWNDEVGNC